MPETSAQALSPIGQVLVIFGAAAAGRILAWIVRFPSIVFLLAFGILFGPALGYIQPAALFGSFLHPLVSLVVAFILFEGGLSINIEDRTRVAGVVTSLVFIGGFVTLMGVSSAASIFLPVPFEIALVIGACLMVTGPTVINPLLQVLRPRSPLGPILHWEGIFIDPLGILCAVLIVDGVLRDNLSMLPWNIGVGILFTLIGGVFLGLVAAWTALWILRRHVLPDELHATFILIVLFGAYAAAERVHPDSGLLSATVFGIALATHGGDFTRHIIEFVETTQGLVLSILFVILSAQLSREHFSAIDWHSALFLIVVVTVVRPVSVWIATYRSSLTAREKWLLSSVAPRGIVAASLASVLAQTLVEQNVRGAEQIVPYVFLAILATVLIYGLFAPLICYALGLRQANPQGILISGAHTFGRKLGILLMEHKVKTILIDSDRISVNAARRSGLEAYVGNILSESFQSGLDLDAIGYVLALTSNDEANALICVDYGKIVGRRNVYQLQPATDASIFKQTSARGRILFSRPLSFPELEVGLQSGRTLFVESAADASAKGDHVPNSATDAVILAVIGQNGHVTIASENEPRIAGSIIIRFGLLETEPVISSLR